LICFLRVKVTIAGFEIAHNVPQDRKRTVPSVWDCPWRQCMIWAAGR
jgi:hypothetical protein